MSISSIPGAGRVCSGLINLLGLFAPPGHRHLGTQPAPSSLPGALEGEVLHVARGISWPPRCPSPHPPAMPTLPTQQSLWLPGLCTLSCSRLGPFLGATWHSAAPSPGSPLLCIPSTSCAGWLLSPSPHSAPHSEDRAPPGSSRPRVEWMTTDARCPAWGLGPQSEPRHLQGVTHTSAPPPRASTGVGVKPRSSESSR